MGITLKGTHQIKTLARLKKSGASSSDRHVRHFQVASLEIERTRRLKERQEAMSRIEATDRRLREIGDLLQGHYVALGLSGGEATDPDGTSSASAGETRALREYVPDEPRGEPHHTAPRQLLVYGR